MAERVVLCAPTDLELGTARRFDLGEHRIALAHVDEGFFAIGDRCSHEDYSLAEGEVWSSDCEIECPRHGSTFDLRTGAACSLPATKPVPVYELQVSESEIAVMLP